MGIFTRVRDIINANINSMLDKAEDPEKLVKLMIREMEDTLIEVKANCASSMAAKKRIQRDIETMLGHAKTWDGKANLAVDKAREDLARSEGLEEELEQAKQLVTQYQSDIMQLEDKLGAAREKQRMLVQRHRHAVHQRKAEEQVRRFETADAMQRFDAFQERIDRMEAEANLVNYGRKTTLVDEFAALETDEEIERELSELKARRTGGQPVHQG
jgi:phage shock protein A